MNTISTRELLDTITNNVLAALENGGAEWRKMWKNMRGGMQVNAQGRPYTGFNQIWFSMIAHANGYQHSAWVSVKNATDSGMMQYLRNNETPHIGIKYFNTKVKIEGAETVEGEKADDTFVSMRGYKQFEVYNLSQFQFVPSFWKHLTEEKKISRDLTANQIADEIIENFSTPIFHGGNSAFFSPMQNIIQMPHREQFDTCEDYYSVMFHEMTHATGPEMGRKFGKHGDEKYAFEELVAELGSIFMMNIVGLETPDNIRDNHIGYLAAWSSRLKKDPRIIVRAANLAFSAAMLISNYEDAVV